MLLESSLLLQVTVSNPSAMSTHVSLVIRSISCWLCLVVFVCKSSVATVL